MASVVRPFLQLDGNAGWATAVLRGDSVLRCDSKTLVTTLHNDGVLKRVWEDPVEALGWLGDAAAKQADGRRWVGYVGYDIGRLFERVGSGRHGHRGAALFCFAQGSEHARNMPELGMPGEEGVRGVARAGVSKAEYLGMVRRALAYVEAGDVFQVNLSQQFTTPFAESAWALAARLRRNTPAVYGACLDFGDHAIVSNSPELLVEVGEDRTIRTRPIKGTRPRAAGMERELLDSKKDAAELNMIVDLERNDLGRVCEIGSVRVEQTRTIETHPTVYHGVATVAGRLRADARFVDILRAMFPGGSVTGAPKIRAMEIIEEIEPVARGAYCGAIGWLGAKGAIQFNVAIRTIELIDGVARFSVGGGIVADSVAEAEYEETFVKLQAMLNALNATI